MAAFGEVSWSPGELLAHRLMHVPDGDNPTSPFLSPHAGYVAMHAPIMAVGVLDENKHPWTTIWGGEAGFARPMGGNFLGIRSEVDAKYDPVAEVLTKTEFGKGSSKGMLISGLAIDLMTRRRAKIMGRVIGGKVEKNETEELEDLQMALNVEQSIGKYIVRFDHEFMLTCYRPMSKVHKQEGYTSGPCKTRVIVVRPETICRRTSHYSKSRFDIHLKFKCRD